MTKKFAISLLAMENIFKEEGASRVSEESKEALREIVEDYARTLARKSVSFSEHARRRTVQESDVKLAGNQL